MATPFFTGIGDLFCQFTAELWHRVYRVAVATTDARNRAWSLVSGNESELCYKTPPNPCPDSEISRHDILHLLNYGMVADPLAILFGSPSRVKLLRFFLFNPSKEFTFEEISRRAKLVRRTARTEINALERAGVIKKTSTFIVSPKTEKKVRTTVYILNKKFPELAALQTFLFETAPINGPTLLKHLKKVGKIDFLVTSGVFVREFEHRIDFMLAMMKLDEPKIENAIRALESELGIEIRYAAFTSVDLVYRVGMHDKLIRDVFDYSHEVLVDKLGIENEMRR